MHCTKPRITVELEFVRYVGLVYHKLIKVSNFDEHRGLPLAYVIWLLARIYHHGDRKFLLDPEKRDMRSLVKYITYFARNFSVVVMNFSFRLVRVDLYI